MEQNLELYGKKGNYKFINPEIMDKLNKNEKLTKNDVEKSELWSIGLFVLVLLS